VAIIKIKTDQTIALIAMLVNILRTVVVRPTMMKKVIAKIVLQECGQVLDKSFAPFVPQEKFRQTQAPSPVFRALLVNTSQILRRQVYTTMQMIV